MLEGGRTGKWPVSLLEGGPRRVGAHQDAWGVIGGKLDVGAAWRAARGWVGVRLTAGGQKSCWFHCEKV